MKWTNASNALGFFLPLLDYYFPLQGHILLSSTNLETYHRLGKSLIVFLDLLAPASRSSYILFFWLKYSWFTEKAMASHSSTLAWKIPWTKEPDRLQSMGSLRVGHDWATSILLFTFLHWRRKWQPTPVFLPGESQGWGSLLGCCLWGPTESDMTEAT